MLTANLKKRPEQNWSVIIFIYYFLSTWTLCPAFYTFLYVEPTVIPFFSSKLQQSKNKVIKNVLTIIQYSCYFSNFLYVTLLYTQQKISECSQQNNCKKWSLIIEFSFSFWYKLYVSWKFKCYCGIAFSFLNLAPSRQEVKHRNNNITSGCFSK